MSEWYPGINASDFSTEPLATAAPMVGFADVLRTFDSTSTAARASQSVVLTVFQVIWNRM